MAILSPFEKKSTELAYANSVCIRKNFYFPLADLFSRTEKKEGLPSNPYLDQFGSHFAGDGWAVPWKIKKDGGDADYVSGATLSSRAVTDLAWRAASAFREHKAELLAPAIRKENVK